MDPVTCQVTEDSLRQTLRAKDVGVHRRRPLRLRHGLLGKLLAVTVAPATFHRNVVQPTNGPPSNYHALQPRLNFVPSPLKGQLLFTRGPVATSMVRQLSDEPEPLKRWKSGANDVRGGSEPDRNVLAFAGNRSRGILDKMWSIAERYNIVVTSVVGANFVLRNYASAGLFSGAASLAQLPTACLAAASAALTTFGGGTQSQLLHWAATFAAGERPLEPLRFGWQRFDPHVGAFMGWSIALVLHCTGRSGFLDGAIWKLALAINWGITVGFGVRELRKPLEGSAKTHLMSLAWKPPRSFLSFGQGLYPPEVQGREGGRQGGKGPAPGSAWVKFKATQVLGDSAAGVFSSVPPEYLQKDNPEQEVEAAEVEAQARRCGTLLWEAPGVPPPDFIVIHDELGPSCRAELCVFVKKATGELKEVRILGPRRRTVEEARKDGSELRREAFRSAAGDDGELRTVYSVLQELRLLRWPLHELTGDDVADTSERRLPEFSTATQAEKFRERQHSAPSLREWIYAKTEEVTHNFEPKGPSWVLVGQAMAVPRLPGIWYVHERQNEDGRPSPWLFFNSTTGKYYRMSQGDAGKWRQTGVPHSPTTYPVTVSHSALCLPSSCSRKDDVAVVLPELAHTGVLLRQPLPFLDQPAMLCLLADGLRGSSAASDFCAKRFHTHVLPRLSARCSDLEDHELEAIVSEAVQSLDQALLESSARYAGCGIAVALLLGRRCVVGALGGCRVVLCRPAPQHAAGDGVGAEAWESRPLAGRAGGDIAEAEKQRLKAAFAPLDLEVAGAVAAFGAAEAELSACSSKREQVLLRVAHATHPFAVLGLTAADLHTGTRAVREAALNMDAYMTQLLANLYYTMDEERGIPSPRRSAAMLGVDLGCSRSTAQAAVERRYRVLLFQLAAVSHEHYTRAFSILDEFVDAASRPSTPSVWMPEEGHAVSSTHALGLRDLKRPRQLVLTELSTEIVRLEAGVCWLMLLTDASACIADAQLASTAARHHRRPRAAAVSIAMQAAALEPGQACGSITMSIDMANDVPADDPGSRLPEAKRRRVLEGKQGAAGKRSGKPARIRVAHVLLKFAGVAESDPHARRRARETSQVDVERELLQLLEELHGLERKDLSARFTAVCRARSDCKSALNGPHADLGWISPGQWGKEFDAAAFELDVGALSDIVITPRGAHLIHRLA